jgi:hypothetical protein
MLPPPDDGVDTITAGTKMLVTLNAPAILWGGRILQSERDPLSNDFFTKTAVELIGRAGEFTGRRLYNHDKSICRDLSRMNKVSCRMGAF